MFMICKEAANCKKASSCFAGTGHRLNYHCQSPQPCYDNGGVLAWCERDDEDDQTNKEASAPQTSKH